MEGNQLKNIQEIEYSLNIMRSRIQKMGEIEGTNGKALNRLLEQTTPILARKMHQVDLYQRQQAKASRNARINDEQHNINK